MKYINTQSNSNELSFEIQKLEQTEMTRTNEFNDYSLDEDIPFIYQYDYLYHGIRNQKHLEVLEQIFKTRKILAGKHIKNYYHYSDNCNKGEYVSLFKWTNDNYLGYETFIESNISLLINPAINAIETKYLPYHIWEQIENENLPLQNLYSYQEGECFVKDYISLDFVRAIGVPYLKLIRQDKQAYANKLLTDIQILMEIYNINLPIVDTSRYNFLLVSSEKAHHKLIKKPI